jgi:hypothetical protein
VLVLVDPQTKVSSVFTDAQRASVMIRDSGFIPLLDDGTAATVNLFEGGYLVQGAPLNAWTNEYWYTGQKQIILPFIQSGQVPQPPARIWNLPEYDPPADVLAQYAGAKGVPQATSLLDAYQTGKPIGGGTDLLLIAGAAVLGLLFLFRRGKSAGATTHQDGL